MHSDTLFDPEKLWQRVGLEKLRQALNQVDALTHRFERTLQQLPKCDQCARVKLLEQIQKAGQELGGEILGLVTLASTLKTAVAIAEKQQEELLKNCPHPCRCEGEECSCHQ